MAPKRLLAVVAFMTPLALARGAHATEPVTDIGVLPPQQPPQYPPQYQQQPPPQYPLDPQYPQYPRSYRQRSQRWRDGDPVPPGYHVEERPRQGLVTAGLIMVLVPYGIGLLAAAAAKFDNQSTWLAAPVVGPWFMMGQRHYAVCTKSDTQNSLGCVGDIFLVMGLVIDGVVQTTGATLFLVGFLATKPDLVRDDRALRIAPTRIGSGYGLGLTSGF